ncbi:putative Whirlin [Hypsibius exemplaris]|uniref:Whirlin n=1 Tax=Hypsibius exemplaris TaxID=2072580 RepID=A0A9X6NJ71_HYPEX|nr:putative Whirlin [Hypsibius exemplaris]
MSSSAAALRQADSFALQQPRNSKSRPGVPEHNGGGSGRRNQRDLPPTAFPFSFLPTVTGTGRGGGDLSPESEASRSDDDPGTDSGGAGVREERQLHEHRRHHHHHHSSSTAIVHEQPATTRARRQHAGANSVAPALPPTRKGSATTPTVVTTDMLDVVQPGQGKTAAGGPRGSLTQRLPISPRKFSVEAQAEAEAASTFMDIFVRRDSYHHDFGFDISGGCDSGQPLTVTGVVLGGPADQAGLCPEDIVLAVDNIKADKLSHQDTVQIIKTVLQIHLKVQRIPAILLSSSASGGGGGGERPRSRQHASMQGAEGKAAEMTGIEGAELNAPTHPSKKSNRDRRHHPHHTSNRDDTDITGELNNHAYAWIDIAQQPCSPPPEEEALSIAAAASGGNLLQPGDPTGSGAVFPERKCVLLVSDDVHLGLLIRGGLEYGLGVYVTGLDKASAAETANLQVGDQILSVNNCDFRRITHTKAVRILRTHRHMTLRVRHVGKLPYARRLTPSSLSSSSSITNHHASAQDNGNSSNNSNNPHNTNTLQSLFTNAALLTDPAEEEIDRLTREAMLEQTSYLGVPFGGGSGDLDFLTDPTLTGLIDMPYESFMLDLELDDEVLRLKQKMKEKRELFLERPRAGRVRSPPTGSAYTSAEYWTNVVERNAEQLLKDETEKEALMYFLREYGTGALGVDALVLSLFHTMDSLPNFQLLDDIRNLISPEDISRYDSLMSGMKTELMSSPGNSLSRSFTGEELFPSSSSFNDDIAFIKPLPQLPTMPLKSAIKSTSFIATPPVKTTQAPTVADPNSYGPVDMIIIPPQPQPTFDVLQNGIIGGASPIPNQSWLQPSNSLPVQPSMPMVPGQRSRFLYGPPEQNQYTGTTPAMQLYPGYLAGVGTQNGLSDGPAVWPPPHGRKSYSIDCLPQSLTMFPEGASRAAYGPRTAHDLLGMRNRPGYPADGYSYPAPRSSTRPLAYDYSDTPAGIAQSASKLSDHHRRQSYLDEEQSQDERVLGHHQRNRKTPTPPDRTSESPLQTRRRNRSVAGSIDETNPSRYGLLSAPTTRKEDRRRSSPGVAETAILEVDPATTANSDSSSPVIIETVTIAKTAAFLGLAIEGGNDTNHPLPRIINIQPKGCAHINGQLKVGHVIISVNGNKLDNLSHSECVSLITGIFADKTVKTMEFVVKNTVKPVAS